MQQSDTPWRLPAPSHVKKCLDKWRGLDLRGAGDDEIEKSLLDLRDSIGSFLVQRTRRGFNSLWRVRRDGRRFDVAREFWYPPTSATKQGRCNRPGEPLLYTSPREIAALDEMRAAKGDQLLLIEYRSTSHLHLDRVVGFPDPNPQGRARILDGDDLVSYRLLREFLMDEFMQEVPEGSEHLYRLSAAICRTWTNSDCADGWIYPSVKAVTKENVAIRPEAADRCLEVANAYLVVVIDESVHRSPHWPPGPGIALKVLDTANVREGCVSWSGTMGLKNVYR